MVHDTGCEAHAAPPTSFRMNRRRPCPFLSAAAFAVQAALSHAAPPAPTFEVAYRAWDVVTELTRHNSDPALGGECGKTFRPFVIPGLRRQTREQEDVAAVACVAAARAACTNAKLRKPADAVKKCEEFR